MRDLILSIILIVLYLPLAQAQENVRFFGVYCAVNAAGHSTHGAKVIKVCLGSTGSRGSATRAIDIDTDDGNHEVANYFRLGALFGDEAQMTFVSNNVNYRNPSQGLFTFEGDFVKEVDGVTPSGTEFSASQFVVANHGH